MSQIKALYGFSPKLEPFRQLSATEAADRIASWGANAVFGGYQDAAFVDAAHAAGLRVYAEFGCFVGERWWEKHPASRPITAQGEPLPKQESYAGVNPCIPAVRQELLDNLAALVQNHQVDGVWLDFIRWSSRWESPQPRLYQTSFDPITLDLFQQATGISAPHTEAREAAQWILAHHAQAWAEWKCQQITSWVQAAAHLVRESAACPCLLGLFGVPWRTGDLGGAITHIMGQDFAALGRYVDVFSPMVYHRMCGQPVAWIASVTSHVHDLSGKPVWPIIQTLSHPDHLSDEEFGQAIDAAMEAPGASGVILFTLKGVLEEGREDVVQDRFANRA